MAKKKKVDQNEPKIANPKMDIPHSKRVIILWGIGGFFGFILFLLWLFLNPDGNPLVDPSAIYTANHHFISLAILVTIGPYAWYAWWWNRRIDQMEEKFAEFLLDLAEYWKVGLSMTTAIETISQGEYGALNKEIKRMATQISWGVAFNDVLRSFENRIPTAIVARSVSLVLEANKAGGKIADVLTTAAKDANEIKWLQLQRKKGVQMYVAVIYISFLVYLGVIAVMTFMFLPAIISASSAMVEQGATGMGGMTVRELSRDRLVFLFFASVLVQAIGNGLMAGMMGTGKLSQGLRHTFIMTLISWIVFGFLIGF